MLEWSKEYLIGIDRIDLEHESFFCLVRDFEKAEASNAEKRVLMNMLEEVVLYARYHFRSEENVMEEIGFPDLENHKMKHLELINSLSNKVVGLTIGSKTPKQVKDFLVDWFLTHTSEYDLKIGEFQRMKAA